MTDANESCVFCKIVSGRIPCRRVHEDDQCLAFLDIAPLAPGHSLLIPKKHVQLLWEAEPAAVAALASVMPRLTGALMKVTGAAGCNVLQSNGRVSGQLVPHVHFHLIPRKEGDGLGFIWSSARSYAEGEAEAIQKKILAALQATEKE
jgi:histidine triad (HIT) family protein